MKIDDYIVKPYARGWVVQTPYEGKDKKGNKKTQFRDAYFPTLEQCLYYIRDNLAKGCETTLELISLLESARGTDKQVLSQSGLEGAVA